MMMMRPAPASTAAESGNVRASRTASRIVRARHLCLLLLVLAPFLGCERPQEEPEELEPEGPSAVAEIRYQAEPLDSVIFEEKMAWVREQQLDTTDIGMLAAAIGRTFVGTPYTPGTLEVEPERLVINLRELDCVTFVETVLAMARIVRAGTPDYASFREELLRIRYRNGILAGYPSRLHYFSEWIANNEEKGIVEDITAQLGGRPDPEPVNFMTQNRSSYRQLADSATFAEIRSIEQRLSEHTRYVIPENAIDAAAPGIRDGDIIAATSALPGLDVAHTGFALWVDGRLHLMHAPLVGTVVEISQLPLGARIRRINTQDGIMVARPL